MIDVAPSNETMGTTGRVRTLGTAGDLTDRAEV